MKYKVLLTLILIIFIVLCAALVVDSGLFRNNQSNQPLCMLLQDTFDNYNEISENNESEQNPELTNAPASSFTAAGGTPKTINLGAADPVTENPEIGFKFQLQLSSKGASIAKAVFSDGDGKGFDDRNYKDPQPLEILSPVNNILSMANTEFVFVQQNLQLPLDKLHWKVGQVIKQPDGSQKVKFEAVLKDKVTSIPVIKLIKTYKVTPGTYMLECSITVENLSNNQQKIRYNLNGTVGINREAVRADMRKVVGGFRTTTGEITTQKIDLRKFDTRSVFDEKPITKNSDFFLWSAITNKYFAAIVVPLPEQGKQFCDWITSRTGRLYNPDSKRGTDDENISINLKTASVTLSANDQPNNKKTHNFQLYIGPKDKRLFAKNEQYTTLGFINTIDFLACCCPASIISPLAFGILAMMEWLYYFIPNYGVVIIILVFIIRLCLHPITKKSQLSMSKMQKLAPEIEKIKKKYANNKAEMNKQVMALYKEQGASPVLSMVPMMIQMPIWIALYSAIYASISLRGAPFLPFWITDLSVPDALFRFKAVTLPLFGKLDSFNLLPIMMGVAFYLQQKLMPKQSGAAANPQIAQQQKMMMIMMPIMFPLMLYKAPSGLNLYIMASTSAGVIEQYVIKKHIREKEQLESQGLVAVTSKTGGKRKKKKPKPFYKQF